MRWSYIAAGIVVLVIVIAGAYLLAGPSTPATSQASTTVQQYSQSTTAASTVAASTSGTTSAPTTANSTTTSTNSSTSAKKYTVNVSSSPTFGEYLVNGTGWTLYLYTSDTPGSGKSTCYGSCATYWPPFYASNLTVPPTLNASDFGVINRTDGTKQLTYKGWPLYYYAGDKAAGQTAGQGVGGTWYVVTVPTLKYPNSTT